jgi:hypothetical protein
MSAPTLLVGLGGTGSDIVRKVYDHATEAQRANISFVIFDTDVNELKAISDATPAIHTIQTSAKTTVGEYLNHDTYAKEAWFPVSRVLNGKALTEGAGQVRAISRLALNTAVQQGKMEEFRKISRKALNFVVLAAAPMTLYFVFFAREGILLLSGQEYMGAVVPMQLIMPTLLFIGLTNILGIQILVPTGREKTVLYSVIVGAVTDVVCNVLLIPRYAAAGAAMSNMIAELAVLIFQIIALRHEVGSAFRSISYWKVGLALVAGSAASVWVMGLGLGSFLSLALSACLFFGAYGIVLLVTKEPLVREVSGQFIGKFKKK